MSRTVVWFSCGAASAAAAKIACEKRDNVSIVYCDTSASEHPDNLRFLGDIERWLEKPVTIIRSETFADIDDVFYRTRYMSGIAGARCTTELKKAPRFAYQRPDDEHVFGLTADEPSRRATFVSRNPELRLWWPLFEEGLTKAWCIAMLSAAGIQPPAMYALGYRNNNCIGCVKATSAAYWNKVRDDFPDVFARRVRQSRDLGVRLTRWKGERIFLDELPRDSDGSTQENVSCGPECGIEVSQ